MLSVASLCWCFASLWIFIGGLTTELSPSFLPKFILDTFIYGKINSGKSGLLVPKRYFSHFYTAGIVWNSAALILCLYMNCAGGEWPGPVLNLVEMMRYPAVENLGDMFSNTLLLVCTTIQVTRRSLECLTVSVYSSGNDMHLAVYFVGITFYAALPMTALSGTALQDSFICSDVLRLLTVRHMVGVALFLWASWQQNRVAVQFAKLRKNKSGVVENTKHHIPHGGLFEYVSCPHYFAEILIYLSLNLITSFQNTKLIWLLVFVIANQGLTARRTHVWYKNTFKTYPKNRKAFIPFVF